MIPSQRFSGSIYHRLNHAVLKIAALSQPSLMFLEPGLSGRYDVYLICVANVGSDFFNYLFTPWIRSGEDFNSKGGKMTIQRCYVDSCHRTFQ